MTYISESVRTNLRAARKPMENGHTQTTILGVMPTKLFLLGGYFCSLTFACWALRTRHKLAFSFGRMLLFSDICLVGAPHTSQTCFFFLCGYFCSLTLACWALRTRHKLAFSFWAGTLVLWLGRAGCSAHVTNLLFLFGRVLWFSGSGGLGAPHTSQTCFFFLGGY